MASRKQGLSTNRDRDALRRELAVMKADLEDSRRREKELQVELERHCNSEEHYRHLTEHALRESEKKYHLLFDASPIGIGLADTEGKIIDANRSLLNIIGYPPEELESIHIGDLYARPEDRRKILDELHREGAVRNAELEVQRRGGTKRWILLNIDGVNRDGVPLLLATVRDITERKHLEQQLLQSQKMETIGRLAGGIAHDFNNILTVINGNVELSLLGMDPGDPLYDVFEEIRKAGSRAASLTRHLLAFSRKQMAEPEVVNLNALFHDMDKMLRRLIGEDIELITIPDEHLQTVWIDPGQIEQVLTNLVVNARDAMPRGGKLIIETGNSVLDKEFVESHPGIEPGNYVMFAVSDTGTGMGEEVRAHIFEPFFTTKPKGSGTGLGLSTCYGIVKQNNGGIWVYSEPGRGTTVKIYLPASEAQTEGKKTETGEDALSGAETVLLVEDDLSIRKLVLRILGKAGYRVRAASNGSEALTMIGGMEPFHLLITDVVMPIMGGKELADRVSAVYPGIKVLFMSGYTENSIVQRGIIDTGVMFIQKPFTPGDLLRKVRETLNG